MGLIETVAEEEILSKIKSLGYIFGRYELSSIKGNLSEIISRQFLMVFSESPSQHA